MDGVSRVSRGMSMGMSSALVGRDYAGDASQGAGWVLGACALARVPLALRAVDSTKYRLPRTAQIRNKTNKSIISIILLPLPERGYVVRARCTAVRARALLWRCRRKRCPGTPLPVRCWTTLTPNS